MDAIGGHFPFRDMAGTFVTSFQLACATIAALVIFGGPAFAQRASESAVNSAEDAFGGSVGSESTGIYTEQDIRGFSPQKAGNSRLNGVYFDQVGQLSFRLKGYTTMRVGLAALNYPFPAPTGIVDYGLRSAGNEQVVSLSAMLMAYDGYVVEADLQQPIIKDHVSLAGGVGIGRILQADNSATTSIVAFSVRPIFKSRLFEFSPFISGTLNRDSSPQLLFASTGAFLPPLISGETYLGQTWTRGESQNANYGALGHMKLLRNLSLRAGWFHSETDRTSNFSEIYSSVDAGLPNHTIIADPEQRVYANSWEAMFAWNTTIAKWQNRLLFGARGRTRVTESGGSSRLFLGPQAYGTRIVEPLFAFGAVDRNTVEQTSLMAGYLLQRSDRFQLNIGVQRANYEAVSRGAASSTSAEPWLYNASISFTPFEDTQFFASYVSGLEDSGIAPETAANRNEQLPASETEQWDAGVKTHLGRATFIASVFQIRKPYFSFDTGNRYLELGGVRHRGVEFSLSGSITDRLHIVAGAVLIDARVSSAGTLLTIGSKPVGVPSARIRVDANYRTDLWGNLTPTATLTYVSERPGSANTFAALNDEQVMIPGSVRLDLGVRNRFTMGGMDASLRLVVFNVFDDRSWRPVASGLYQLDDRRRINLALIADL